MLDSTHCHPWAPFPLSFAHTLSPSETYSPNHLRTLHVSLRSTSVYPSVYLLRVKKYVHVFNNDFVDQNYVRIIQIHYF